MNEESAKAMTESLAPLYRLEDSEGWRLLKRHFELTEGFAFIVVTAPDDWGVALLRAHLPEILPAQATWVRVRFDPDASFAALSEQLLELKVAPDAVLIWIDADPADVSDVNWWEERREAWKQALARLNRYRNTLQARFACTLAIAGPAGMIAVLRESAPDIFAIRSSVIRIEPPGLSARRTAPTWEAGTLEAVADQGDPAVTLAEAEKLRGKPGKEDLLVQLLMRAADQAEGRLLWQDAIDCLEEAYGIEQQHGADPQVRLNLAIDLQQALKTIAQFDRSEFYAERAREIAERYFGNESSQAATALNNLAVLLQDTNRLAEAEPLMKRALAIGEQSFGPDHPNVAIRLNNLGQLLQDTNRLAAAEPLMKRALAINEQSFGPDHPNVATCLNNLAQLLQDTNRLTEAEPLMKRALAIDEESFGPDHPNVARDLNNLALLLKDTNRLAEAEPLMKRALTIEEQSFGPDHPTVAIRLNNLARLLHDTNRLTEAEPLLKRAIAIDEQSFGPNHPQVAICLNNLALLLKATNRLAEAEPLLKRALTIFVASLSVTHPSTQSVRTNYAALLKDLGRTEAEIEAAVQQVLADAKVAESSAPKRLK